MIRFCSHLCVMGLVVATGPLAAQPVLSASEPAESAPAVRSQSRVAVLGYSTFASAEGMRGITPVTFRAQMSYLKEQGITPVSLQQFIDWKQGRRAIPEHCVLITLEEADASAYAVAFPILKEFGFPCVVFVDGRAFSETSGMLGLGKLQEMQQAGASIGCRSMTRPQVCDWVYADSAGPDASQKMAERELGLPAQRIISNFGSCEAFSYPRGYADKGMVENLAVYGYKVAFGLHEGKVDQDTPSFMLNRYMVSDMPSFARAVNFDPAVADSVVLQQVRASVTGQQPLSSPVIVDSPEIAHAAFPSFRENLNIEQPPLPPAVDPLPGQSAGLPEQEPAPIPSPVADIESIAEIKDPVLEPRPVHSGPAAGKLIKRTPEADWTTQDFVQPLVPREQTRVAVLGYHNFSNTKPVSDMRMRTSDFCQQMQYIQDAGLTVITMQDFQEWLLGERCLPERCVLITIDDGWRSVYTDAFPVLKAYGYPFTLFLYTSYLSGKGQSMTPAMIQEMQAAGATVGCHSASHLYPSQWKRYAEDSPEYAAQLEQEIPEAVDKLKSLVGNCSTYWYPGGYHTPTMEAALSEHGVQLAFTVLEKKVTTIEQPLQVHRYMVFGTDPRIFRRAVNFDDVPGIRPTAQGITEARERARSFFPKAFEVPSSEAASAVSQPVPADTIPAPVASPASKAELGTIPEPVYTTPPAS